MSKEILAHSIRMFDSADTNVEAIYVDEIVGAQTIQENHNPNA